MRITTNAYRETSNSEEQTQHAPLKMIETWRVMLNKSNKVGTIIMDLFRASDTLNHNLFLFKLKSCGFNKNTFNFIQSYFTIRHQRIKVGDKLRDQNLTHMLNVHCIFHYAALVCADSSSQLTALKYLEDVLWLYVLSFHESIDEVYHKYVGLL